MSPDNSDQLTRSLRSDCKALQSVMESMLLKILVPRALDRFSCHILVHAKYFRYCFFYNFPEFPDAASN